MIVDLPDSKIKVDVRITRWQDNMGYRFTQITAFTADHHYFCLAEGKSCCSPKDNFSKLIGRKLAYRKMIDNQIQRIRWASTEPIWSKVDRRVIFQAVCPSYFKSKKVRGR